MGRRIVDSRYDTAPGCCGKYDDAMHGTAESQQGSNMESDSHGLSPPYSFLECRLGPTQVDSTSQVRPSALTSDLPSVSYGLMYH